MVPKNERNNVRTVYIKKKLECKYLITDYGSDLLKEMEICLALFSRLHLYLLQEDIALFNYA
jgi:hypothetical protein